ncbi:MAG: CPBP family intramembrane metalloprotease, partial [Lachnospiraceae bacterium]|nr:CPBP family intramembrane metalloprotease [Lachnospiraceae bacterium]
MKKTDIKRIFLIIYPLLVYYILYYSFDALLLSALDPLSAITLAGALTVPFMWMIYRRLLIPHNTEKPTPDEVKRILLWTALIISTGVILNIAANLLPNIADLGSYEEDAAVFDSGSLIQRILATVIVIPVLEELTFRVIVLGQLLQWMPKNAAVIISGLLFGIAHFNILQFVY